MIHRHLTICAPKAVERWPSAAIADLLDRGDLEAWRPIAAAIRARPRGPLADRVLDLLGAYPLYGTSALWRAWIDRCRARIESDGESDGKRAEPVGLATVRHRRGLTQADVAARVGMSQSDLSKFERRSDVRFSSLRAYAKALGGRIEAVFAAGSERIELRIGAGHARSGGQRGVGKSKKSR